MIDVEYTIKLPEFKGFSTGFWQEVGRTVAAGIVDNIVRQVQANGEALKKNHDGYAKAKYKAGRGSRSLVNEHHRFVQGGFGSWGVLNRTGGSVTVGPMNDELRDLATDNMMRGYKGYVGVSKETLAAIKVLMVDEIQKMARRATRTIHGGTK